MKQNMKRVLLVLCMVTCLFSLSACSNKADEAATLDESTAAYISQISESLLQQISSFNEADAVTAEEGLRRERQTVLADGLASWLNIMNDTGSMTGIVSSHAEEVGHGEYSCTVLADYENRKVEFKIFYLMEGQNMEPTSISFAPEYTTGEKMEKAAMNTLMGMGTVFLVLIFISLLIGCFKYINAFEKTMKNQEPAAAPVVRAAPVPVTVPSEEEELVDDLELVAVITAAIAAATGSSTEGLVVRSIRRAPGAKWKRA